MDLLVPVVLPKPVVVPPVKLPPVKLPKGLLGRRALLGSPLKALLPTKGLKGRRLHQS